MGYASNKYMLHGRAFHNKTWGINYLAIKSLRNNETIFTGHFVDIWLKQIQSKYRDPDMVETVTNFIKTEKHHESVCRHLHDTLQ